MTTIDTPDFAAAHVQAALRAAVSAMVDACDTMLETTGDIPPWLDAAIVAAQDALYHHIARHGSNP